MCNIISVLESDYLTWQIGKICYIICQEYSSTTYNLARIWPPWHDAGQVCFHLFHCNLFISLPPPLMGCVLATFPRIPICFNNKVIHNVIIKKQFKGVNWRNLTLIISQTWCPSIWWDGRLKNIGLITASSVVCLGRGWISHSVPPSKLGSVLGLWPTPFICTLLCTGVLFILVLGFCLASLFTDTSSSSSEKKYHKSLSSWLLEFSVAGEEGDYIQIQSSFWIVGVVHVFIHFYRMRFL